MGYRVVVAARRAMSGARCSTSWPSASSRSTRSRCSPRSRSQGDEVEFGDTGKMLKVQNIEHFDPAGWDIALFAIGSEATEGPRAAGSPRPAAW